MKLNKKQLDEIGYHEKQQRDISNDEHEEWLRKKSEAKKRYYDSQKKDDDTETSKAIDYYDYKNGSHPAINEKKTDKDMKTNKVTISEAALRKMIAENIKKHLNEVGDTFGGQFKLARLETRYKKMADKAERAGDYAKAEMYRARAEKIRAKADSEYQATPELQNKATEFAQSNDPFGDMWRAHGMAEGKKNVVTLSEEQLRKVVVGSIKKALNESNLGELSSEFLRNAAGAAYKQRRPTQGKAFADYGQEVLSNEIGADKYDGTLGEKVKTSYAQVEYQNGNDFVTVRRDGTASFGNEKPINIIDQLESYGYFSRRIRVDDKRLARVLAKWADKVFDPGVKQAHPEIPDYHTWCNL